MLQTLRNAFKIPELRKRILFTLFILLVFRLGSYIPVPGIDKTLLEEFFKSNENNVLGLLDIFSGGAFSQASIFAMSITPYINSSIIMQLLTIAIPALEKMQKEGEEGRKKIAQFTRYGTVVLAFIQATGLFFAFVAPGDRGFVSYFMVTLSFTAGTAFLMWLGEQITENGIGNGISLLIFAGIVSRVPVMGMTLYNVYQNGGLNIITLPLVLIAGLVIVAVVVIMNNAERRIPVQYAKRMVGRKMYGGQSTHIPIKVSMAGVIPIIFAMSIMMFPSTIMQMFNVNVEAGSFLAWFQGFISPTSWFYMVCYFILILFFTYFYTAVQFNPVEIANNIKKNNGTVPGMRQGRPTAEYIGRVVSRITLAGALFLAVIAVLPLLLSRTNIGLSLGGTSLLIVVGVALDTVKQLEAQMLMRHYKGFLE